MITKIKTDRHYVFDPSAQIIVRAEVKGYPEVADLKRAIVLAVGKHDTLNSKIVMDTEGDCYYVPVEGLIPDIEVIYENVENEVLVNREWKKELVIQEGKMVRFVILQYDDITELVIIQHHLGGDGKSIVILLNDIMDKLVNPSDDLQGQNRERCVKVYDKKYLSKYIQLNELLSMAINELNNRWETEDKIFELEERTKVFENYWRDKTVEVKSFSLNKDEVNTILGECRAHGVKLNNLLTTIVMKNQVKTKKIGIIADMRHATDTLMGNFASSFMLEETYDETKEFWENATYIENLAASQLADRDQLLILLMMYVNIGNGLKDGAHISDYHSKTIDDYVEAFGGGSEGMPICISNLGVANMKSDFGKYGVEKMTFVSPLAGPIHCNISVATINDCLVLNMSYVKGDERYEGLFDRIQESFNNLLENIKNVECEKVCV